MPTLGQPSRSWAKASTKLSDCPRSPERIVRPGCCASAGLFPPHHRALRDRCLAGLCSGSGRSTRMKRTLISILFAGLIAGPAANTFDLQGHRGARGLAPENHLAAFQTALKIGVATLELDLAMTKDDVLVVSHDRRLN